MTESRAENSPRQTFERILTPKTAVKVDGRYAIRYSRKKDTSWTGKKIHRDQLKVITPRDSRVSVRRRDGLKGHVKTNFNNDGVKFTNFPIPSNGVLPIIDIEDISVDLSLVYIARGINSSGGVLLKIDAPEGIGGGAVEDIPSDQLAREILAEHEERSGGGFS